MHAAYCVDQRIRLSHLNRSRIYLVRVSWLLHIIQITKSSVNTAFRCSNQLPITFTKLSLDLLRIVEMEVKKQGEREKRRERKTERWTTSSKKKVLGTAVIWQQKQQKQQLNVSKRFSSQKLNRLLWCIFYSFFNSYFCWIFIISSWRRRWRKIDQVAVLLSAFFSVYQWNIFAISVVLFTLACSFFPFLEIFKMLCKMTAYMIFSHLWVRQLGLNVEP